MRGAFWAVVWAVVGYGASPALFATVLAWLPRFPPGYDGELTQIMLALREARETHRRRVPLVMVVGNSPCGVVDAQPLAEFGGAAVASLHGKGLNSATTFARFIIDTAQPDVLLMPLYWGALPGAARTNAPATARPVWDATHDDHTMMDWLGLGRMWGLPRQVRTVGGEYFPVAGKGAPHEVLATAVPRDRHEDAVTLQRLPAEVREYYNALEVLGVQAVSPGDTGLRRCEALQRYGAEDQTQVLLYVTPPQPVVH